MTKTAGVTGPYGIKTPFKWCGGDVGFFGSRLVLLGDS